MLGCQPFSFALQAVHCDAHIAIRPMHSPVASGWTLRPSWMKLSNIKLRILLLPVVNPWHRRVVSSSSGSSVMRAMMLP